ncbi:MAG: branched-chain amino acid ABC transporter permease [Zestosphaera sp.]
MIELPPALLQVIVNVAIALIVTLSLNLEAGFLGLPQFGRVLAVIIGAIVAGAIPGRILALMLGFPAGAEYAHYSNNFIIVNQLNEFLASDPLLSIGILLLTLLLAALLGGIIGFICAYPAIRLTGTLGITLLAFGDIVMNIAWNYQPLVGGTTGVAVLDPFRFAGPYRFTLATFVIVGIALLTYVYIELLGRSPFGRTLKAARDAELAASVYGKDIVKLKRQTLIIGGSIAAIGGALWAIFTGSMKAYTYTRLTWTFWPWAYMMLGGLASNLGILVGITVFITIRTLIYTYKDVVTLIIPISPEWLEYILVGLVIVVMVLFKPQGIIPERPVLTIRKNKILKIKEEVSKTS